MALELNKSKRWAKELNQSRLGGTRRGQSSKVREVERSACMAMRLFFNPFLTCPWEQWLCQAFGGQQDLGRRNTVFQGMKSIIFQRWE